MMANEPRDPSDRQGIDMNRDSTTSWSWHGWSLHVTMLLLLLVWLLSWSEERDMNSLIDEEPAIVEDTTDILVEDRVIVQDGAIISGPAD